VVGWCYARDASRGFGQWGQLTRTFQIRGAEGVDQSGTASSHMVYLRADQASRHHIFTHPHVLPTTKSLWGRDCLQHPSHMGRCVVSESRDKLRESSLDLGRRIRQVPDHQEVFLVPNSQISVIVEVLQRVAPNDDLEAAKFGGSSIPLAK